MELVRLLRNESVKLYKIDTSKITDMSFLFCAIDKEDMDLVQGLNERARFNFFTMPTQSRISQA